MVAVARLQAADGSSIPLLPFVRCLTSKNSSQVAGAVDEVIGEVEALTLPSKFPVCIGQRLRRLHTDKGT